MPVKEKRKGFGLEMKTFAGRDKGTYLVFRTGSGQYHTFVEVEAKEAARQCGVTEDASTTQMWRSLWKSS